MIKCNQAVLNRINAFIDLLPVFWPPHCCMSTG